MLCNSSTGEGSIIPLKLAAIRAGLGWQGKHSLLVTKKFGTFLALGGIVTNAVLEHNEKEDEELLAKHQALRAEVGLPPCDDLTPKLRRWTPEDEMAVSR